MPMVPLKTVLQNRQVFLPDPVPFSIKCLCATSYINDTQLEALMSNKTINVENTLVKDSSQVPRNKFLKIFHQNIRGLR
jgi:uncharacterized membrane protein YukC